MTPVGHSKDGIIIIYLFTHLEIIFTLAPISVSNVSRYGGLKYNTVSESKPREIVAHAYRISSQSVLPFQQVYQFMGLLNWASGLIPLGRLHLKPLQRHFHALGLTNQFTTPQASRSLSPYSDTGRSYLFSALEFLSDCFR